MSFTEVIEDWWAGSAAITFGVVSKLERIWMFDEVA